jgi:poly(A) polymerase
MTEAREEPLDLLRAALAERPAWLVGGAPRDRALGRRCTDFDVVVDGDPREAARALAALVKREGSPAAWFPLSEQFGAWRVAARDGAWQVDLQMLQGGSLQADLAARDFTVNAIAEDLRDGSAIDPLGGLEDLRARRLRMASERAFAEDPLRVLRLVRMAVELDLEPEPQTSACAQREAAKLASVSPERMFVELQRTLAVPGARRGLELLERLGAAAVVLPELGAMAGVEQSKYHHLDVYDHTLEVLDRLIELQADLARVFDAAEAAHLAAVLDEPLSDGLTRGQALRWGALLHDAAKPQTRGVRPGDGRVTFLGHDAQGAELARTVLKRLRTSARLREHVAALVRHHLRLGFLVHKPQPLAPEAVFDYLTATGPVAVDVTLLSVADRLATKGEGSGPAIEAHLRVARQMLSHALCWREEGPPKPLLRGDELVGELGLAPGPRVGELLTELARAQFAGRVATREQALGFLRRLAHG